ncbi:MAG: hypothetical protein F4X83_09570 [Chloroflexi bacterium]|nr:hypothetical protein [Chloroflexota bacterium]
MNAAANEATYSGPDQEIFSHAFSDPITKSEMLYPALTSLDCIYEANSTLLMPVEHFFTAYDNLQIEAAETLTLDGGDTHLLHVEYTLGGATYYGHAYAPAAPDTAQPASLTIPGSGLNCSEPIYRRDPASYHDGILDALGDGITNYVFIKPNEDCLAFHNGEGKVDVNFFVNWHLNNACSYSAAYIVSAMAITKWLQQRHDSVVVTGLSQGGGAALLTSLQSRPTAAVIASGFSVIMERIHWSGHNQIIIPGIGQAYSNENVRKKITASPTQFLFTYGRQETLIYGLEAQEHYSCDFLAPCPNVRCESHDGGHIFHEAITSDFLRSLGM